MSNIIEIIAYVLITIAFFGLIYSVIMLYTSNRNLSNALKQSEIEKDHLMSKLSEYAERKEAKKVEQTEGFLKFVSQSRDWAFSYIEGVQDALRDLQEAIDILQNSKIKSDDRKKALKIIEQAMSHLPED